MDETFWWDDGADGVADPHQNVVAWTYDALGRVTDEVFSSYDDLLEYSDHFTFDLAGNRLEKTRNWTDPGKADETVSYAYDSNDWLLKEELRTTGDGQPEKVTTYGDTGTQQASKEVVENGTRTSLRPTGVPVHYPEAVLKPPLRNSLGMGFVQSCKRCSGSGR